MLLLQVVQCLLMWQTDRGKSCFKLKFLATYIDAVWLMDTGFCVIEELHEVNKIYSDLWLFFSFPPFVYP